MTTLPQEAGPDDARATEAAHLNEIQKRLNAALQEIDRRLNRYARDIQEQKTYLWESRADMDHVEKISSRESIQQSVMTGEKVMEKRERLKKLLASPYFGRLDFRPADRDGPDSIYIGIHHFHDEADNRDLVYDWRSPVAGLFYDFETGPARYESPTGTVDGEIQLKRQFRIKHGRIEMMIDSAVHVVDEVLQEELSRNADDGMRNIVATIQRDQNSIIRNEDAPVLVIQGVAGSGKTSIALHRIAFLLYRFKDTLSSEDILIISPNRVFADYIANVLPELGEETVNEIGMEQLAEELLDGKYRFQTFMEQTSALLEKDDEAMKARLQFKSSPEFLRQLSRYAAEIEKKRFAAEDVWVARRLLPAWLLEEIYRKHHRLAPSERIAQTAREAGQKFAIQYHHDLEPEEFRELRERIRGMVNESTLRQSYREFFDWLGRPEMFQTASRGRLEYADVFPLIYLRMRLENIRSPYRRIRHLLIDEMQDYTPVQYAVIEKLFRCNKTILGDANQSVNPYCASSPEDIQRAFPQASRVTLNKSYRSSYEITRFAQRIQPNPDLEAMERHDEEPQVLGFKTRAKEKEYILDRIDAFNDGSFKLLGIICKTQKQATRLHKWLAERRDGLHLLAESTQSFNTGVVVCSSHMAKGLEFDQVIVPEATEANYQTDMERNLLYVACTRAMHRLAVTHTGDPTPLLEAAA